MHLTQKRIQNLPDRILLSLGHRCSKYIQRIVHLLERRCDNFFKAVRHLHRKLFCHLFHGFCLSLLAGNQKIPGLILRSGQYQSMKTIQKILHCLGHGRIPTLHSKCVHNRKRNTINRSKKGYFYTINKGRYRSCHHLIICRLKVFQSPDKTNKCSKNTKTCKNIRCHFQKPFVNMDIHIIDIYEIFNLSDSLFCTTDAVYKIIHLFIQIPVTKNSS